MSTDLASAYAVWCFSAVINFAVDIRLVDYSVRTARFVYERLSLLLKTRYIGSGAALSETKL